MVDGDKMEEEALTEQSQKCLAAHEGNHSQLDPIVELADSY